jgi:hypothetical protein
MIIEGMEEFNKLLEREDIALLNRRVQIPAQEETLPTENSPRDLQKPLANH